MDEQAPPGARQRVVLALAGLAWLAGCTTPPGGGDAAQPAPAAPPAPPPPDPAAANPPPAPAPPPPPPPPVPIPAGERAAAVRNVQNLLQDGDATAAEELCRRILAGDPNNAQVQSYLRQIEGDPQVLLGRESYAYVVKPGESLSSIARDRMRDTNLFFVLARYNNIRVPRQLSAGQTIRIPGKAPANVPAPSPPPPPPPPPPAPAPAPEPATPATPAAPAAPSADERLRRINTLMRDARTALARQDPCRALRLYDSVLALDANHAQAPLERQRTRDLVERLRKQGSKLDC